MADDLIGLGKAVDSLAKPMQELLSNLLGPVSKEAGEIFTDQLRYIRWRLSLTLLEKSQKEIERRNIKVQPIPLKTLMPILDGASLESEDQELQSKWVNLLVNAASGSATHPSYPKILSELIQAEAKILDYLYDVNIELGNIQQEIKKIRLELKDNSDDKKKDKLYSKYEEFRKTKKRYKISQIKKNLSLDESFSSFIDNLIRLRLCEYPTDESSTEVVTDTSLMYSAFPNTDDIDDLSEIDLESLVEIDNSTESVENITIDWTELELTILGTKFIEACRNDIYNSSSQA